MVNCNHSRTPVDTESKLGDTCDVVSDPTLYRNLAGSLQYLTFTRPDISYRVQQVCLHMPDPREPHLPALKRILRYVCSTLDYGLQLFSSSTTDLVAYSDAYWVGCPTTQRSTSEVEYRGVANAVVETWWLRNLLRELHTPLSSATIVYCDNVSAVYLYCSLVQHQRTKHIEIDIHFVRDLVAAGQINKTTMAGTTTKNITLGNSDLLDLSDTTNVVLAKGDYGSGLNSVVINQGIACNWGETVFVDEDADENIAAERVRVCEFANWVPNFTSSDKISHYDYESEALDNDDDIHSINKVHEEGEINDKEDPLEKAEQHPPKVIEMKNQPQGKSSRVGLSNASSHSHTKRSPSKTCQSTGSMIDNFIRHINIGTALGYDMTRSQADLKKFIDSIRVKHDFNVVRNESERIGSNFNFASATAFNDFILEGRFWDTPLGGHAFTRITSNGDKLSKLDRFLISEDITNVIHNLHATVIDCHISDHRPIVLKQSKVGFGPTPFKLFNSWMLNSEFDALVTLSWNSAQHIDGSNSFIHFKEKMKRLKYDIKNWSRQSVNSRNQEQEELKQEIIRIELNIEAGNAGSEDEVLRQSKIRRLKEIDKQEHIDMSQKAKIK
ncbi:ribonuclease H-like domain-containing protein [Tanacetum coccineum]